MTIAEKSTELDIDLAQLALDKYGVSKCKLDGAFHCFTINRESGEKVSIHIFDDNGDKINANSFTWSDDTLAENSTLITVETAFKDFINAQEFIPKNTETYEPIN